MMQIPKESVKNMQGCNCYFVLWQESIEFAQGTVRNSILFLNKKVKVIQSSGVENQAGERAGVTEWPRLLLHRRATPTVEAFVGILEQKFLGVRNSHRESVQGSEIRRSGVNCGFLEQILGVTVGVFKAFSSTRGKFGLFVDHGWGHSDQSSELSNLIYYKQKKKDYKQRERK